MRNFLSVRVVLGLGASLALFVFAFFFGLFDGKSALAEPASIIIETRPIFWDPENPSDTQAGELTYIGGLELTSEHPDFGGLSGLIIGATGDVFIAVSDQGKWVTADLISDGTRPIGVADGLIAPIMGSDGTPLSGKRESDSEGIALPFGQDIGTSPVAVSFERHHRIQTFDLANGGVSAEAEPVPDFGLFDDFENNKSLEAITYLSDGSLLAISEETLDADGHIIGARLTPTSATPLRLRQHLPFMLTDLANLPNGDLVTLERHYSPLAGVSLLIRRIPVATLESDEPLDGDVLLKVNSSRSIDNMEGLSVRVSEDGTPLLYLISDNNFNPLQRTLLLVFALND